MDSVKEREPGWNDVKSKQEVVNVQSGVVVIKEYIQ
jgi:hypothetical protein